jgi:SecD/SecF fusion protein
MRLSKQFTGGIEFKLEGTQTATQIKSDIEQKLKDSNLRVSTHPGTSYTNVLIQQTQQNEDQLIAHSKVIQAQYGEKMKEFAIVGPSIGKQVSSTAVQAIVWWLILMALFIVFEFSKIRKFIQPWVLAIITIVTMLFDILSPMGIYGLKMMFDATAQVDVIFIIALLTTMGYSINDTIIIFDRVREHLETDKNKKLDMVFEDSLWETMGRSLMTSGSTLIVVLAMYALGTGDLKNFAFVMIFGIISGTLSSIFLAAPIAYLIIKYTNKNQHVW